MTAPSDYEALVEKAATVLRDEVIDAPRAAIIATRALEAIGLPTLLERVEAAEREIERLRNWKAEAMQVMSGLQDVGNALGVPLGQQITARATVDTALDLRNQSDALATKVVDAYDEGVGDADAAWVAATRKSLTGRATITNPYRAARTEGTEGA